VITRPAAITTYEARAWRAAAERFAARAGRALFDFALPRHCVACAGAVERGRDDVCCGACWAALPLLPHPQCDRCGHPLVVGDLPPPHDPGPRRCRWCDLLPPYVRAARSVCWAPEGAGGALAHALKYDGWVLAAHGMGARMAALPWPEDVLLERAALVPVPLSASRLRERGYNQSAALAAAVAARWHVPVWDDVLVRARTTRSQTRLTPGERLANVAGAFRADSAVGPRLRGVHVVLVDDVVTTAATLNACAAALVARGARVVSYVTFGRARS
jgi:predicted amidophosphoribosyltransferase